MLAYPDFTTLTYVNEIPKVFQNLNRHEMLIPEVQT
jgi:hypothetical protein